MFERRPERPIEYNGLLESKPISFERVAELQVIGSLLKGAIRQLLFGTDGALLVLAGRGVVRLDPESLKPTGSWLEEHVIKAIFLCGERLWVFTDKSIHLAPFGEELGAPLARYACPRKVTHVAHGSLLAFAQERSVTLLDADSGESKAFSFSPEWLEELSDYDEYIALLSPCGKTIGVAVRDSRAILWDVETGECIYKESNAKASVLLDNERYFSTGHQEWHNIKTNATKSFSGSASGALLIGDELVIGDPQGGFAVLAPERLTSSFALEPVEKEYGTVTSLVCLARSRTHTASYAAMEGVLRVMSDKGLMESHHWSGAPQALSASEDGTRAVIWRDWGNGRADVIDLEEQTLYDIREGSTGGLVSPGITKDGESLILPCGTNHKPRSVYVGVFGESDGQEAHKVLAWAKDFQSFDSDKYAILTAPFNGPGEIAMHQVGAKRAIAKVKHSLQEPSHFSIGYESNEMAVAWEREIVISDITKRPKAKETIEARACCIAMGPLLTLPTLGARTIRGISLCVRIHPRYPSIYPLTSAVGGVGQRLSQSLPSARMATCSLLAERAVS